jgi:hypothetical protein
MNHSYKLVLLNSRLIANCPSPFTMESTRVDPLVQVPSLAMQDRPNVPLLSVPRALDRRNSNKGEHLAIDSPTFYKSEQEASASE